MIKIKITSEKQKMMWVMINNNIKYRRHTVNFTDS